MYMCMRMTSNNRKMKNIFALGDIMRVDYEERVTGRTQRALSDIGVTSTFVKLTAREIKKLRRQTDLDPVKFLCEIYRLITGKSFFDEEYKKLYDCNERIILSSIAFLTLPETIIELHRRLPMPVVPKIPPKPVPASIRPRGHAKSPYLEEPCIRQDWSDYKNRLEIWKKNCRKIAIPKIILPNNWDKSSTNGEVSTIVRTLEKVNAGTIRDPKTLESYREEITDNDENSTTTERNENPMQKLERMNKKKKTFDEPRENLINVNSSKFDGNQPKPIRWKNKMHIGQSVGSKRDYNDEKSWLGEKVTKLIVAGKIGDDDDENGPTTIETGGVALVTPNNSDESFFRVLKLKDTSAKTYPRGRDNLSRNWREWLQNVDEDYAIVEKRANEIIKSVNKTLKLMGGKATCDSCCACRQTWKADVIYHKTKMPHVVVDSIAIDEKENKYVVGCLAMTSPAPSPSESREDVPDTVASHDEITKTRMVGGVTDDNGQTTYHVFGVTMNVEHVSRRIVSRELIPKPVKNVPPCNCAIKKTVNEGLSRSSSHDNIPWTVGRNLCVGKKYRPLAGGASSCREYPDDKSCRRNPFGRKIDEEIGTKLRIKEAMTDGIHSSGGKNLYGIADFRACGDEDGMAVCGGPWGAVNVPDEEEMARRAAEEKLILQSPPCGDKPGRSICGAPFGARHPVPKKPKKDDDADDDEDEEEKPRETIEKTEKQQTAKSKNDESSVVKILHRDPRCSTISRINSPSEKFDNSAKSTSSLNKSNISKDKKKKISKDKKTAQSELKKKGQSSVSVKNNVSTIINDVEKNAYRVDDKNEDSEVVRKRRVKEIKNQWNGMKRLMSKFASTTSMDPKKSSRMCKRESESNCDHEDAKDEKLNDEDTTGEGPFGWRTKSEQQLPAEKTLIYLVEPDEPVKRIPVRIGGKPCKCRENRNSKKILIYGVTGITTDNREKRDTNYTRVIDGTIHITPTPSTRNSNEYIPEYELYDLPYEKCLTNAKNNNFHYIEKYLGPKSLMTKKSERQSCNCSDKNDEILYDNENSKSMVNERQTDVRENSSSGSGEFEGEEFSEADKCDYPRKLQVLRPVCECRYERKIVRREEEKKNWLKRQTRVKSLKKVPGREIAGVSRPMTTESNFVISNVTRSHRDDDDVDNIEYCVDGVTQHRVMGPVECIVSGVGMHTPMSTPEPSKASVKVTKDHRHWSLTNIQARPSMNVQTTARLELSNRKNLESNDHRDGDDPVPPAHFKSKKNHPAQNRNKNLEKNSMRLDDKKNLKLASGSAIIEQAVGFSKGRPIRGDLKEKLTGNVLEKMDGNKIEKKHSNARPPEKERKAASHNEVEKNSREGGIKQLLKDELKKMSNEGFVFAKLPDCWQIPQLRYWLMYRKGIAMTPEEKKKLMDQSIAMWNVAEKRGSEKLEPPAFDVLPQVMDKWNFDGAEEIKREIASKKEMFYSHVRKLRVLQARNMWGLMEFGKFPGISFKRAYFTYQASKESDGFVFKPWKNN